MERWLADAFYKLHKQAFVAAERGKGRNVQGLAQACPHKLR